METCFQVWISTVELGYGASYTAQACCTEGDPSSDEGQINRCDIKSYIFAVPWKGNNKAMQIMSKTKTNKQINPPYMYCLIRKKTSDTRQYSANCA